jgi:hypothetical protein
MMINAGQVGPDTELLINDDGRYVLRAPAGQQAQADADQLAEAIERTGPLARLAGRSQAPIALMSARLALSLERVGCRLDQAPQEGDTA